MNHKTDHTSVIVHKILIRTLNSTILRALASQPEISTELDNLVRDSNTMKFIFRTIDLLCWLLLCFDPYQNKTNNIFEH